VTTSAYPRALTLEHGSGAYLRPSGSPAPLGPKELDRLEEELRGLESELRALNDQIEKDSRGRTVARGITQYRASDPTSSLDRARELLLRRDYDVAFVGNFSCGKSTLINAVLGEPRFLPTDQTECTLAIARVGPPHPERGEGVEVEFFTEAEALQNVLSNARYKDDFGEAARKILRAFDVGRAQSFLQSFVGDEQVDPPKRTEIGEFLDELEQRRRDGTLSGDRKIWAPLSERARFLSKQEGGIGPILLVKEVRLFRENALFVERGVRVVDLPGTNAVSAAVEEKIDEFLRRADVVIGVTGPEGFTRDERTMLERFQKFNLGAANRVMFVMNRMDLLDPKNLISAESFRAYFRRNFVEVVEGARLRADRIFMGSALWVELEGTRDRTLDEESRHHQVEVALQEGRRFLEQMKGLEPDLRKMLGSLYEDGGVPTFRAELLRFLERDVRRERLREVALQLRSVRERLSQLLEPERATLGEVAIEGASAREVRDHLEKLSQGARRRLLRAARDLPGIVQQCLGDAKVKLAKVLQEWALDPEKLDLEDARRERPGADGPELARLAVERGRMACAGLLVELVAHALGPAASTALDLARDEAGLAPLLQLFDDEIGPKRARRQFAQVFKGQHERLKEDLVLLATARAREEAWRLADVPVTVRVAPRLGEAGERELREKLARAFTALGDALLDALAPVLGRHTEELARDHAEKVRELVSGQLADECRRLDVALPRALLDAADPERARKLTLMTYLERLDRITRQAGIVERPLA
jgi:hypothetical protein